MKMQTVAIRVAAEASSSVVPFSGPVIEALLEDVLDVQDEQVEQLRKLEDAVQRLIDGPWRAGRLRLREAALPGRSPGTVRRLLEGAADNFRDAVPLQVDPSFSKAQVCLDLSVVLAILGDSPASRHYAEMGYLTARHEMWSLTQQASRARKAEKYSASTRERLTPVGLWYDDFELSAAVLSDPHATRDQLSVASAEAVPWRAGTLLDRRYLTEQDQRRRRGTLTDWAAYDSENANARSPGTMRSYHTRPLPPWDEFWGQPRSVIGEPRKPDLKSRNQVDADRVYTEQENSGLWD